MKPVVGAAGRLGDRILSGCGHRGAGRERGHNGGDLLDHYDSFFAMLAAGLALGGSPSGGGDDAPRVRLARIRLPLRRTISSAQQQGRARELLDE